MVDGNAGLLGGNPKLQIRMQSDHTGMGIIAPPSAPKAIRKKFKGQEEKPRIESVSSFFKRTVNYDGILGKLFTDYSFLDEMEGGEDFMSELWECPENETACGNRESSRVAVPSAEPHAPPP